MNHHGVWLRVAIEVDGISIKAKAPLSEDFSAEAIVVWLTFRSPTLSLTNRVTTLIPLLFCSVTPVLDGWAMVELVITYSFHHYRYPEPRRIYGLFRITWSANSARWTSFLLSTLLFVWVFSKFISAFIFPIGCVCCWLCVAMSSQIWDHVLTRGFGSSITTIVVFIPFGGVGSVWIGLWCFGLCWV